MAQQLEPGYFRSPLDIPLYLSGNFGEMRSNHFHTGLDIKTEGREGLKVYAIADGTISRIKISSGGYGLILYISHPNGYTSAYAHLSRFNNRISDYIKIKQYEKRLSEIDISVPDGELPVSKGEVIAFSGNSGGSGGPHLHFEIRDTKTEQALNPLMFGFDIKDDVKPNIVSWRGYALKPNSSIDKSTSTTINVAGQGGVYSSSRKDSIIVHGEIGFAIHTTDMLNGSANVCGIYSIDFFVDDTLIHQQKMDHLDFNLGRFMNAHCDYKVFRRNKSSIHKCFLEANNKLPIYPYSRNRGKVSFYDDKPHAIRFVVKDVYGNTSIVKDTIYSRSEPFKLAPTKISTTEKTWKWNEQHTISTDNYVIEFPAENLYRNENIKFIDHGVPTGFYSNLIELGDDEIALHSNYVIKLKKKNLPDSLEPFAFIAQVNEKNRILRSAGNKKSGDFLIGSTRNFGRHVIALDQNSPTIKPINIVEGKEFAANEKILFTGSDDLTGIESYNLYIDNTWAMMYYDAKYARFSYTIDPSKILLGNHRLQFVLTDGVGNSRTFECNFVLRK